MTKKFSWWPDIGVSADSGLGWGSGFGLPLRWSETFERCRGSLGGDVIETAAPDLADDRALRLEQFPAASVIALVGLAFEARIAAGPGVLVICQGTSRQRNELLQLAVSKGCRSIISFGVAGGLASDLLPGDCVVASGIVDSQALRPTDPIWSRRLLEVIPDVRYGAIVGVNAVVASPAHKRRLHAATGAVAVDMESHLVARLAAAHGLAFAAVRVVIDPVHRPLPRAVALAMSQDGSTDVSALLRYACARPSQLSALMRLAIDAYAARATLVRLRRVLGPHFKPAIMGASCSLDCT